MTVLIARDAVASDHLVYAWPFPIGPECEVTCGDDEQVVMCPAFLVGDRLGPGRHHWRSPDPMRPVGAFFVLVSPVEVSFDMTTSFVIPSTGQPVRLRAVGSLQVRCGDPGLLIAQFVGLPFDTVNEGILRSVSRSIERMLARLLTRRVVMGASPVAVTDPGMLPGIKEELVAYNPTAGAVFGVELIRLGHLVIASDDGSAPYVVLPNEPPSSSGEWAQPSGSHRVPPTNGASTPDISLVDTARGRPAPELPPVVSKAVPPPIPAAAASPPPIPASPPATPAPPSQPSQSGEIRSGEIRSGEIRSGEIRPRKDTVRHASVPPADNERPAQPAAVAQGASSQAATSGEIVARTPTNPGMQVPSPPKVPANPPGAAVEVPRSADDITQPGVRTPVPGSLRLGTPPPGSMNVTDLPGAMVEESRGSILGIGMSHIGSGSVAGEIPTKVAPGSRVLVPGPNGLMQSATVRQLLQGYYELEVGSSGETIWVPINGVVPES